MKTTHEMAQDLANLVRQYAKEQGVPELNIANQGTRHLLHALARVGVRFTTEAGAPPQAAVGLTIEGIQNALQFKDETIANALGSKPVGDA